MTEVVLKVAMTCEGCVGAVSRVLNKTEGVESVDISLEDQTVKVKGTLNPQELVEIVSKTGKKTELMSS